MKTILSTETCANGPKSEPSFYNFTMILVSKTEPLPFQLTVVNLFIAFIAMMEFNTNLYQDW